VNNDWQVSPGIIIWYKIQNLISFRSLSVPHIRNKRTATSVSDNLGSFNLFGTTVIIIWYPRKEYFAGSGFLVVEEGQSADEGENTEDAEENGNNDQDLEDEPVPASVAHIEAELKCSLCLVDFGLGNEEQLEETIKCVSKRPKFNRMYRVSCLVSAKLATPNTDKWRCMRCADVCMLCDPPTVIKGKKGPAGEINFIQCQFCSAKVHIFYHVEAVTPTCAFCRFRM
jgi:hypothetical protein